VRVPRRMYVSKFQRYGGAVIVVVLAVAVGAGMTSRTTRSRIAASSRCALASSARGAEASPSWSGSAGGLRAKRAAEVLS
jgi:hypothetical protein